MDKPRFEPDNSIAREKCQALERNMRMRIRDFNDLMKTGGIEKFKVELGAFADVIARDYTEFYFLERQANSAYEKAHGWKPRKGNHLHYFRELRLPDEALPAVLGRVVDLLANKLVEKTDENPFQEQPVIDVVAKVRSNAADALEQE